MTRLKLSVVALASALTIPFWRPAWLIRFFSRRQMTVATEY